jgi:hypothetical protein
MAAPPAYLDECIDRPVAEALRARGFDILTALDAGQGGRLDEEQLQLAWSLGRVLITYDRSDFRRLHAMYVRAGRRHGGIVTIPQVPPVSRRQIRAALMLDWLGTRDDYRSNLFQWNDLQQRLLAGFQMIGHTREEIDEAIGRI